MDAAACNMNFHISSARITPFLFFCAIILYNIKHSEGLNSVEEMMREDGGGGLPIAGFYEMKQDIFEIAQGSLIILMKKQTLTSIWKNTSSKKPITPIMKPSFRLPPITISSCPVLRSVP